MRQTTYHIPANFTDAGKLLGFFETRNVVEAALLCAPAGLLCAWAAQDLPCSLTMKIILSLFLVVPVGGFALLGIRDDSLSRFLKCYFVWRRGRMVRTCRGVRTAKGWKKCI